MRRTLLAVLHLFTVFSFFAAGIAFMTLALVPEARLKVADLILVYPEKCSVIGLILLAAAFVLLGSFALLDRGRYLVVQMGVSADLDLVRQAVEECFLRQFEAKILLTDLTIGDRSRLEMNVTMAQEDEKMLGRVEKELSLLMKKRFSYAKPFDLIVKR